MAGLVPATHEHEPCRVRMDPRDEPGDDVRGSYKPGRGVHSSPAGSGAKIASTIASLTPPRASGDQAGLLSLSTITERTPSLKSCVITWRRATRYSVTKSSAIVAGCEAASRRNETLELIGDFGRMASSWLSAHSEPSASSAATIASTLSPANRRSMSSRQAAI